MTEVERKEDFRPEEFIDWIKDEPAGSETVSDHTSGDAYGFKDFFDTLADTLSARAGGDDRDLIDALEEKKKKKAAEEAAKKAAAKRAESGIGDIFGADDDDERKRGIAFKSPFAEMTEEELDAALKKANKNTYWEFGLHTEKKRRAGKVESFIYEKEGTRIPVLPTYTNRMEREVCGEPVAVSFGDLPRTKNVNSIGNPNAIRYTTHLEIHFDITEGAETKEGKSAAYMKAQSFLAAAYRGDTLGGKPVRRFRLNNMSEEELKAWGEVRAAFEGQGKKIEFILTDEQQKVFDRYAAKFAEITKLNRELVSGVKEEEETKETPRVFKDVDGKEYDDITRIPEGAVFDELDLSGMDFTKLPEVLATCTVKKFVLHECNNLTSLEGCPKGIERFSCSFCDSLTSLEGSPEGVKEFHCENCASLSSLKGCPKSVKELWCNHNLKLTSLEGLPEGLEYINLEACANVTSLEGLPKGLEKLVCANTGITSLKGCPEEVKELFCGGCVSLTSFEGCPKGLKLLDLYQSPSLTSLKGIPEGIEEIYLRKCYNLTSLEGCPKSVKRIDCSETDITSLDGCPKDIERINCANCDKLVRIPSYIPDEAIEGLSKEKIAECKKNWIATTSLLKRRGLGGYGG